MKIALIQQKATEDREANRKKALDAVDRAAEQGAKVICFAELAFEPFYPQEPANESVIELAETIPGPTTEIFCAKAKEREVVLALNLFEREGERAFDSSPVIDADGTILGITRMVHITEYEYFHEQGYYAPGDSGAPVYTTKYGNIGIAICYDRHFPEYMRALGLNGAEIVIIPQAGAVGEWPEGLYEAEMRIAAFQNGYFTALCNRVGKEKYLNFAGESFVCDPYGNVIARAGEGAEEILFCEIDKKHIELSYARKLFFKHRRPELYAEWLSKK